jgi:hypothetical protein
MFSTRDRAEQNLHDDGLGEQDGYFIEERGITNQPYAKLLADEAQVGGTQDDFLRGR